jgi:hypothetical protein
VGNLDDADGHLALQRLQGAPALVIASGSPGHLHAYWPLTEPVAVTTPSRPTAASPPDCTPTAAR